MQPETVFFIGIFSVGLLVAYFAVESERNKRRIGLILTAIVASFTLYLAADSMRKGEFPLGIDLQGGSSFTVQLQPGIDSDGNVRPVTEGAREQAIAVLENRLNPDGGLDLVIAPQGDDRLQIQMPGITEDEIENVRQLIQQTARLEFRLVHEDSDMLVDRYETGGDIEPGWVLMEAVEEGDPPMVVRFRPDVDGVNLSRAGVQLDPSEGWIVLLDFDSTGRRMFGRLTEQNVGRLMAIVIDEQVFSAPRINSPIYGSATITGGRGGFSESEARALANVLQNPLQNPLEIVNESTVTATYGANTVRQGIYAGILGLSLTLVFMVLYYRLAGLIALTGLTVNICIVFGTMALFGFTLTMPGIAGLVLTIGIAIDANVLIYERLREEMAAGKSIKAALQAAYDKAFSAIFDANITTLITALILFYVASGIIQGFAITLTIGILASLFAALLVTRTFFNWGIHFGVVRSLKVASWVPNRVFDPLSMRRMAVMVSAALLLLTGAVIGVRQEAAIGIDFRGGSLITANVVDGQELPSSEVIESLQGLTFTDNEGVEMPIGTTFVQRHNTATGASIQVRGEFASGVAIERHLSTVFADRIDGTNLETVGPLIGGELARRSALALVLGLVAIFLYVSFRFETAFAVGAVVALLHDLAIAVGLVLLTGTELSLILVGAFLTIAGYSINDTIVVFDRIREMLRSQRGDVKAVMNLAISATLSRTLLTSGTTLVSLLALAVFGGPDLRSFAVTIMFGVIIGTYSSIFVASPIVLWWARRHGTNLRREILDADAEAMQTVPPASKA